MYKVSHYNSTVQSQHVEIWSFTLIPLFESSLYVQREENIRVGSSWPMEKEEHIWKTPWKFKTFKYTLGKGKKERAPGFLIESNILRRLAIFCRVLLPYAKGFCFVLFLFSFLKLSQLNAVYLTHLGHFLVRMCNTVQPKSRFYHLEKQTAIPPSITTMASCFLKWTGSSSFSKVPLICYAQKSWR